MRSIALADHISRPRVQRAAKQAAEEAEKAAAKRRIKVFEPAEGWTASPSTKKVALRWGAVEVFLGVKRVEGEDEKTRRSFVQFTVTDEKADQLKREHGIDLDASRPRGDIGLLGTIGSKLGLESQVAAKRERELEQEAVLAKYETVRDVLAAKQKKRQEVEEKYNEEKASIEPRLETIRQQRRELLQDESDESEAKISALGVEAAALRARASNDHARVTADQEAELKAVDSEFDAIKKLVVARNLCGLQAELDAPTESKAKTRRVVGPKPGPLAAMAAALRGTPASVVGEEVTEDSMDVEEDDGLPAMRSEEEIAADPPPPQAAPAPVVAAATVEGAALVEGGAAVEVAAPVEGAVLVEAAAPVEGAVLVEAAATVEGGAPVDGGATVEGAATVEAAVTVEGVAPEAGAATVEAAATEAAAAPEAAAATVEVAATEEAAATEEGAAIVEAAAPEAATAAVATKPAKPGALLAAALMNALSSQS